MKDRAFNIAVIALSVFTVIVALSYKPARGYFLSLQREQEAKQEYERMNAPEVAKIEAGKGLVRKKLKDPVSAIFTEAYLGLDFGGENTVCGMVNSKNSYGAYVGNTRFYADKDDAFIIYGGDDLWMGVYGIRCVGELSRKNDLIGEAKKSLREGLKDPESSVFSYVYVTEYAVCGLVGERSPDYGYMDWKRFVVNGKEPIKEGDNIFDVIYKIYCKG